MNLNKKCFNFPFFGILMGFLPLLILWNTNVSQIQTRDVYVALLVTLGFVTFFSTLFLLLIRNKTKAGLVLSAFFLFFFTYGHVYSSIKGKLIFGIQVGFLKLGIFFIILLFTFMLLILLNKRISTGGTVILNIIVLFFCIVNLVSILSYNFQERKILATTSPIPDQASATVITGSNNQLADIYYIVLDAYSRQDILKSLMNYDNSAFINSLRQRGFYVADCANANYGATVSSMASSLNYQYFDLDSSVVNNLNLTEKLINNNIRADLKDYGYRFVTTHAFSGENDIPNSDIYLDYLNDPSAQAKISQNQFLRLYFETTLDRGLIELYDQNQGRFSGIPNWLIMSDVGDGVLGYATYWYHQTNFVFDSVKEFAQKDGNYFVYAHINLPHGPYVFDADGNFKYVYMPENNIPHYNEAVTYANKRTLELIDNLIWNSSIPPIIILQGDHGAHVITSGYDKNKILSAYYYPPEAQAALYPTITPVNTFRIILRDYFDQEINLLPDLVYGKELNTYEYRPSTCENVP